MFLLCSHPGPVNQSITFSPSQRFGSISFGLMDDSIALEDPERFQLRFSQHSFPDGSKVRLGPNSDVSILDDDGNFYYYKIMHFKTFALCYSCQCHICSIKLFLFWE